MGTSVPGTSCNLLCDLGQVPGGYNVAVGHKDLEGLSQEAKKYQTELGSTASLNTNPLQSAANHRQLLGAAFAYL